MPLGNPAGGFNFAPEFQSSALPWVSSSNVNTVPSQVTFNYVTRFISLTNLNTTGALKLGFTLNGINGQNYATVAPAQTLTLEWRCSNLWLAGAVGSVSFSLAVGLTTVPAGSMPMLSGSFPDGTAWSGVG
jgi:hypothetical protein